MGLKGFQKGHKINNGKILSKEHKEKIKETQKKTYFDCSGIKHSNIYKNKLRELNLGEKNPMWKGGISFEPYSVDWTETLKRSIRERDHYICQLCNQYGNVVHHIDYNKQNCSPKNLITLGLHLIHKVNTNRNYWIKYFSRSE